jgi:hypothetical protein
MLFRAYFYIWLTVHGTQMFEVYRTKHVQRCVLIWQTGQRFCVCVYSDCQNVSEYHFLILCRDYLNGCIKSSSLFT